MKTKLGLTSFGYRWAFAHGLSVQEFISDAAALQLQVVQLCENSGVAGLESSEIEGIGKLASGYGLSIEYGISSWQHAELKAGIETTATLGGSIMRAVVDGPGAHPEDLLGTLRSLLPQLKDSGVIVCLENHFRFDPALLRSIIVAVDSPQVAACIDPLNSICNFVGPDTVIRELAPYAVCAHVKDATIIQEGVGFKIKGTPLGEGLLDIDSYFNSLGPQVQSILLESWMEPASTPDESCREEKRWINHGIEYLRTILPGR